MGNCEKKLLLSLESSKEFIYFVVISVLGVVIRVSSKEFISGDMSTFLIPWYNEIKTYGGIAALKNQVGDYGVPYQFLIALMTYIPVKPLYVYKLFSCFFDFGLAVICAKFTALLTNNKSKVLFLKVYGVILFLPTVVINSSIWGQCDAIYSFFTILSLYYLYKVNIPDGFPSAVRWYGNHFLDSFLCILNHNFYEDIGKGCCAPQMRQGLDQYPHRNVYMIKHKKGDFRVPELRFPKFRICDFEPQEYS